jgi:outer membrane protein assembly factor BamD
MAKSSYFYFIAFFIVAGCVTEPKVNLNSAEGLYTLGEFYEKQERYEEAINQYKTLSNKFPYSKLAADAEMHVADCYYKKEEFPEAFNSYRTFKELHPRHPRSDYVTFRAAESLREQLPSSVDRDLTNANQAISYYDEILTHYSRSQYEPESKEKRFKLIQMLADKEVYIADFYYGQNNFLSALTRYEQFLQAYPQNVRVPHVLLKAASSAKRADVPDKMQLYLTQLLKEHPNSSEAQSAKGGL